MGQTTDRKPYVASDLNLERLRAYAKRVARETKVRPTTSIRGKRTDASDGHFTEVELFGSHWPLLQVSNNGETNNHPHKLSEWQMRKHWILASDGGLYLVTYSEEYAQYESTRGSWRASSSAELMTAADVLEMDHDHPNRRGENRARTETWWGDYNTGRLRSHAAGVGASLALKRLLPPA